MNIYSFIKLTIESNGFYDLFKKTLVNKFVSSNVKSFIVTDEYEGRIDLVCRYLHGSSDYVEELMTLNGIINPHSIKTGDELFYYTDTDNYGLLRQSDPEDTTNKDSILLMNKQKNTKKDKNRIGSPPTIKPDNLKQLDINYNKKKITIINKFK